MQDPSSQNLLSSVQKLPGGRSPRARARSAHARKTRSEAVGVVVAGSNLAQDRAFQAAEQI